MTNFTERKNIYFQESSEYRVRVMYCLPEKLFLFPERQSLSELRFVPIAANPGPEDSDPINGYGVFPKENLTLCRSFPWVSLSADGTWLCIAFAKWENRISGV